MAGQDAGRPPEDPSALAECVKNADALDDAAMRRLTPTLRQIAAVAASVCGLHGTDRADLIDQAPSLFFERREHYDPRLGKVERWWYRVCANAGRDIQRRKSRRPTVPLRPNDIHIEEAACFQKTLEKALDLSERFSPQDVEQITSWSPQSRVVLMCLTGLWDKVDPEKWEEWCSEFGLPGCFPPDEFAELADRSRRALELSRLLNITTANLAQIWCRGKQLLQRLDYWEGLR